MRHSAAALISIHLALLPCLARDRDLNYNQELQAVEAARYQYRVEGDASRARAGLAAVAETTRNDEVRTQSLYLLGRIFDDAGKPDSAIAAFKRALAGQGLQLAERVWLIDRMMVLSPGSVQPITADRNAVSGPARTFSGMNGRRTIYILEFRGPPDGQWERAKEIGYQDENGDYRPLDLKLGGREELLDADADHFLVLDQDARKIVLGSYQGEKSWEAPVPFKVEAGSILPGDPAGFIVVGGGMVRVYRGGKSTWETPLAQEGCAWSVPPDRTRPGALHCSENRVYLVDTRKSQLKPVMGISDKALQVSWAGEYLVIRYIDRLEVRAGPAYETVKWSMPSPLQEKLVLGNGRVYLVTPKGEVKSIHPETGVVEWQRDLSASQLTALDGGLFATTFAQTLVSLDLNGKPLWTHEFGWGRDPVLLPTEEWMVLHYGDGKRVKLNRSLLRLTGRSDAFKFLGYQTRAAGGDLKGALASLGQVLSLEPGNGQAWKLRAGLLRNLGAPGPDQLQALVEASRSQATPAWGEGQVLKSLASGLGANWVWKRQYGPKFYPSLISQKDNSFYLENDNQTLVLLNHETGEMINSFRFSEELDMKIALWKNDTICVSSPSRLYLLSPGSDSPGGLGQLPLKNPVCQAQPVGGGIVYSDWYGGLRMVGLPDRTTRWEKQLGQSGLYLGRSKNVEYLDVVDLEGRFFAVQPASGKILWETALPPGTITETFSTKDYIFAGYSQGMLIAIDRAARKIAWTVDLGEQIFSLSGNRENTLVLTTASKRLVCIQANTGAILSQVRIQSYLFNRPTVFDQGYWLGTTEPALEKRTFGHELLMKYSLPDLPGSPGLIGNSIFIGTLDNFILSFPSQ